jgi:hypothetical protein
MSEPLYHVHGTSYDGFPIDEKDLTWNEAKQLCKEAGLNVMSSFHCEEQDRQEEINNLKKFTCEFCGVYSAEKPKCNKCEEW